jgi:glyoxylase-like metal-dependent hydrolase (beta-lactamase superfamily II)
MWSYLRRPLAAPPFLLLALACSLACSSSGGGAQDCEDKCDAAADADPAAPAADAAPADAASVDATPVDICDSLGSYPAQWISGGPACTSEDEIQVHQLNDDTYILRQSLCTSGEGPFLYLLFGEDKALLEDTGDGGIDIVGTVNAIVEAREAAVGHAIELIVVNSHAHGDHVGANVAFSQDGATVVGADKDNLSAFFTMGWPHAPAAFDLGNRVVDIFGIPGHQGDHIAIYDRQHGILLTGDTFYPGRLFINDFAAYKASIDFLVSFTSSRDTCAILGTHIEMTTTPGQDYDFGVNHHPNERELALDRTTLIELQTAINAMGTTPVRQTHDDFIIFPL